MTLPDVAVAVVSWNTRDLLAACLDSLAAEADRGRAEVWVVDNGSSDGSPELVRDRYPWVRLHAGRENLGFGRAVNLVASQAQSRWIAPANADVELTPGALGRLLDAGAADPDAGALAPRLVLPDGSTQHSVFGFPTLPYTAAFNVGAYRLSRRLGERMCLHGFWNPDRPRRVPWAVGAFLLVRRDAWEAVGGFDPEQWMYAEDLDLGWRLARAGCPTRYVPDAIVLHHESAAAVQAWGEDRVTRWQDATYAWMRRRRGVPRARTAAAMNVAGATARWAAFRALAVLRPEPWAERSLRARRWRGLHARGLRE